MKLLFICQDRMGERMAGPAIRCYELAVGMADLGHDVTVLLLQEATSAAWEVPGCDVVTEPTITVRTIRRIASEHEVVITQPIRLHLQEALHIAGTPVIFDMYVPGVVEQATSQNRELANPLRVRQAVVSRAQIEFRGALASGHSFLCASEVQRTFLLGALAHAGRLNMEWQGNDEAGDAFVRIVPFGLSDEPPVAEWPADGVGPLRKSFEPIQKDDLVLLWAGGIWNWLDPLTIIRAVAKVREALDPNIRLCFMGAHHPNPDVRMAMLDRARSLATELDVLDKNVFFLEGWVPYDERGQYLLDADIGVSAHFESLETTLSFRQRLLDHIWATLPTIATRGDSVGDLMSTNRASISVDFEGVEDWVEAIAKLSDQKQRQSMVRSAERLRSDLTWRVVCGHLQDSIRNVAATPRIASSRSPAPLLPAYFLTQSRRMGLGQAIKKATRVVKH